MATYALVSKDGNGFITGDAAEANRLIQSGYTLVEDPSSTSETPKDEAPKEDTSKSDSEKVAQEAPKVTTKTSPTTVTHNR